MLNGRNNEEKIWNYLKGAGLNDCGAAGLMGNLYAESGLRPDNLQNTYEKKLGMTDASYTAAVDGGTYTGFVRTAPVMGWHSGLTGAGNRDFSILPRRRAGASETWRCSLIS